MSNVLAQAARAGFRPVWGNSTVRYGTVKQQGGKCCSQILQLSDKKFYSKLAPGVVTEELVNLVKFSQTRMELHGVRLM